MKKRITLFLVLLISVPLFSAMVHPTDTFKDAQMRYPRVRQAYELKGGVVDRILTDYGLVSSSLEIYIRALKAEQELQVFARDAHHDNFQLIRSYPFCSMSGTLGPKERQGDFQVPEGCYFIDRFNPNSAFHLSLGVNYPNQRDRQQSPYANLGGDIFLHGDCVTIGCIPITDDKIRELYILAVEAKNAGQSKIPVHFFPAHLTDVNFEFMTNAWGHHKRLQELWKELKPIYDAFEATHQLPSVKINAQGRYAI